MGFVKGNSFQRYGYLRVSIGQISGHDFTTKDVGVATPNSQTTSKKKTLENFQVGGFKSFFTLYMGINDPI